MRAATKSPGGVHRGRPSMRPFIYLLIFNSINLNLKFVYKFCKNYD
jgi:hypothetical protein